jgi:hypothetical protein
MLLIGALLGDWVGRQLFAGPGSAAGPPAAGRPQMPIEVAIDIPASDPAASSAASAAGFAGPAPSTSGQAPAVPGPGGNQPGNPGNPGSGGNSPPSPTVATTNGPPQPGWGSQLATSIQVQGSAGSGGTQQLGRAEGWFQMFTDRTKFRYSFTFCRQSSYILPTLAVSVNGRYVGQTWQSTPITTINPNYSGNSGAQPCYGATATVSNEHSYSPLDNVYFLLSGSTFNGTGQHVVFTQDRTFYNSN